MVVDEDAIYNHRRKWDRRGHPHRYRDNKWFTKAPGPWTSGKLRARYSLGRPVGEKKDKEDHISGRRK